MSAALVFVDDPALALFFYGGMVRAKNVLNMIMMSPAWGPITVIWVITDIRSPSAQMSVGNSRRIETTRD